MSATDNRPAVAQAEPEWVEEVLRYWFEEVGEAHWFHANTQTDAKIRDRFLALHQRLDSGEALALRTPRATLAAVIVLDQFSRNLYRGAARAYASDALARRLADTVIRDGHDLGMTLPERQFLYMPFQHSEDRQDQARSVGLFERLGNESWLKYAQAHQSIIERFGRFPHRNAILDRQSSPEEVASLNEPMGSF